MDQPASSASQPIVLQETDLGRGLRKKIPNTKYRDFVTHSFFWQKVHLSHLLTHRLLSIPQVLPIL